MGKRRVCFHWKSTKKRVECVMNVKRRLSICCLYKIKWKKYQREEVQSIKDGREVTQSVFSLQIFRLITVGGTPFVASSFTSSANHGLSFLFLILVFLTLNASIALYIRYDFTCSYCSCIVWTLFSFSMVFDVIFSSGLFLCNVVVDSFDNKFFIVSDHVRSHFFLSRTWDGMYLIVSDDIVKLQSLGLLFNQMYAYCVHRMCYECARSFFRVYNVINIIIGCIWVESCL